MQYLSIKLSLADGTTEYIGITTDEATPLLELLASSSEVTNLTTVPTNTIPDSLEANQLLHNCN